jgi:hypothetical protein
LSSIVAIGTFAASSVSRFHDDIMTYFRPVSSQFKMIPDGIFSNMQCPDVHATRIVLGAERNLAV